MRKSRDNFNIAALFLLASSPFGNLGNLFPLIDFPCPEDFFGIDITQPFRDLFLLSASLRTEASSPASAFPRTIPHQIKPTASTRF